MGRFVLSLFFISLHASAQLRINDIQVLGTHNSYKQPIDPFMDYLFGGAGAIGETNFALSDLSFGHPPLTPQLEQYGVRHLELDLYDDPEGGRYANFEFMNMFCPESKPYEPELFEPGFKVMHDNNFDFHSNCYLFTDCLTEISTWSGAHPDHLPVVIFIEIKNRPFLVLGDFGHSVLTDLGLPEPLPVTDDIFLRVEQVIFDIFDPANVITPPQVIGSFETLKEAVLANNWPSLEGSRGKVLFVLLNLDAPRQYYLDNLDPSRGQTMFFNFASPDDNESAFLTYFDPIVAMDEIKERVSQGFMVRTRADAATKEAFAKDYRRANAAFASGAQFVSTDFIRPNPRIPNDYHVVLPSGNPGRCNPVRTNSTSCTEDAVSEHSTPKGARR